jgi:hypothetical protein
MCGGKCARCGRGESSFIKSRSAAAILAVFFLWVSPVPALDRMGSPVAQYGQGQLNVGWDYASGETDLKARGHSVFSRYMTVEPYGLYQSEKRHSVVLDQVNIDRFYTTIGYGLCEQMDLFFRLGGSRTEWRDDGGTDLALSGGVRATLYSVGRLKVGGLAQMSWSETQFEAVPFSNPHRNVLVAMEGELSLYEIQVALAASYDLTDQISLYGGPFFYFADGDLDLHKDHPWIVVNARSVSLDSSYDLDEASRLGGYLGAQYKIDASLTWGIEYQYADDAHAVATGIAVRL